MNTRNKRMVSLLLTIILLFVCGFSGTASDTDGERALNVVFVIDASGSMIDYPNPTDPDRVAVEAAKIFMDNCKRSDTTVSVLKFYGDVCEEVVRGTLESDTSTRYLTRKTDELYYQSGCGTRIGTALDKAVSVIEENKAPNKDNLIILLSDGCTDNDQERQSDIQQEAINRAISLDCNIYTIGINHDNSLPEIGRQNLEDIAGATGGICGIFDSVKGILQYFEEIYCRYMDYEIPHGEEVIATGDYQTKELTVPNAYISEANINVITQKGLSEFYIYDPNGNEITESNADAYFSRSRLYTTVKIFHPQEGKWTVKFRGVESDSISISFLPNYNLTIGTELNSQIAKPGDDVVMSLFLNFGGERIRGDQAFYEGLTCEPKFSANDSSSLPELKRVSTPDGVELHFKPNSATTYSLSASLSGIGITLNSETVQITVKNTAPSVSGTVPDVTLSLPKNINEKIDLSQVFFDPDAKFGQALTYSLSAAGDEKAVKAEIDGNTLVLRGKKGGNCTVTVTAEDDCGASASTDIQVAVSIRGFLIKLLFLVVAALIVLAGIAGLILWLMRKLKGTVEVRLLNIRDDNLMNESVEFGFNGRKETLTELLRRFAQVYGMNYGVGISRLEDTMRGIGERTLDNIVFCGTKGLEQTIELRSRSFKGAPDDYLNIAFQRVSGKGYKREFRAGDDFEIQIRVGDAELNISFRYCPQDDF